MLAPAAVVKPIERSMADAPVPMNALRLDVFQPGLTPPASLVARVSIAPARVARCACARAEAHIGAPLAVDNAVVVVIVIAARVSMSSHSRARVWF
jgi:hypothetical protein|mmetsp:Transcript_8856/g.32907  ORF Transcript_8856/g.32907 Transcript_8856/m.32907 type:complete len:96 (+) Transcript_8856:773-1060(+)